MYRLIAMDIDGTLLNSKGEITDTVRSAIKKTQELGVQIAIVSGRNIPGINDVLGKLGLDLWFISSGGANISNYRMDKILWRSYLKNEDAKAVIQEARKAGAGIFLERPDRLFWEGSLHYLQWIISAKGLHIEIVNDLLGHLDTDPLKITLVGEVETVGQIELNLKAMNLEINMAYSTPRYLEITRTGVNKGAALKQMADHLNIPLGEIIAIGDGENDIPMFAVAGLGIAMGNAPENVRQAADLIVPTNDEDGLAYVLKVLDGSLQA